MHDEEEHVVTAQKTVSTVKKSQATVLLACVFKNSRQLGPARCGADSRPEPASSWTSDGL